MLYKIKYKLVLKIYKDLPLTFNTLIDFLKFLMLTIDSFLSKNGLSKKRRIKREDILNKEEEPAVKFTKLKKLKKAKQSRKIIGKLRDGPINFVELAEKFKTEVSLLQLFQLLLEVTLAFKELSTRPTFKKMKKILAKKAA
ncbi:unnamed protein product [Diplocarpon coronariae]